VNNIFDQIKNEAKQILSTGRGSHAWDHTERVYNNCMKIGKKESADMEMQRKAQRWQGPS
jgi:HD superfamily phosphodiesterase